MSVKTCVICGSGYTGRGNSAEPVKDGRCCNGCNLTVVIPERARKIQEMKEQRK